MSLGRALSHLSLLASQQKPTGATVFARCPGTPGLSSCPNSSPSLKRAGITGPALPLGWALF